MDIGPRRPRFLRVETLADVFLPQFSLIESRITRFNKIRYMEAKRNVASKFQSKTLEVRELDVKYSVGSISHNTPAILERRGFVRRLT